MTASEGVGEGASHESLCGGAESAIRVRCSERRRREKERWGEGKGRKKKGELPLKEPHLRKHQAGRPPREDEEKGDGGALAAQPSKGVAA